MGCFGIGPKPGEGQTCTQHIAQRQERMGTADPGDKTHLRRAFGSFATGVTVVTAREPGSGALVGLTVNSFASVSMAPPLVSWALRLESRSLPAFETAAPFAVNMLTDAQRALSARFARADGDKFDQVAYRLNDEGVPLLDDCLGCIECTVAERLRVGDHAIIIGRVTRWNVHEQAAPLIVYRGKYLTGEMPATANH